MGIIAIILIIMYNQIRTTDITKKDKHSNSHNKRNSINKNVNARAAGR